MEDQIYETDDDFTLDNIKAFETWLDDVIGTEYERNPSASGEPNQYYLMIFDLTHQDVDMIRTYERTLKHD